MTTSPAPAFRLVADDHAPAAPVLDERQAVVAAHRDGPLLVLAGPGTGKTTTLVESVVSRVHDPERPLRPEQILVLTFSRKAADELRARVAGRLGRTLGEPMAWTFHAFCYALVRAFSPPDLFAAPLRLLTGPEQEVAIRELLRGDGEAARWPDSLRSSLHLRGFAEELRTLLARARDLGLDPEGLRAAAQRAGRADWVAAAGFLHQYLDVLDAQGALDYAELVHRAVALAERPEVQARLRATYAAVYVDEYQDTDPAQERLLHAIAGDGRDLVVVGDPDQSIYAFRGAELSNILEFPQRFPRSDGSTAPVAVLGTSRRAGAVLLQASRCVAQRLTVPSLPVAKVRQHRGLLPVEGVPDGSVEVLTFPSIGTELEAVADVLRRAHLHDGVPWADMAIIVRSGQRSIPLARRVLGACGVPVEVAGDELPLAQEPAVAPLLLALRCASDPVALTVEAARSLLLSPLGGADAADLRRLGRALRARDRERVAADGGPARPARSSAELLRAAVADPTLLAGHDLRSAAPAQRLGTLLQRTREVLAAGGAPEDAVWELWSGTSWPRRLEGAALGGGANARAANRDLDAVCALFDAVSGAEERHGHRGVRTLLDELEAQHIPGDTLAERALPGSAVRLLTAHRSKGLEWPLVVVLGVQEGVWPDLRRRGSLLEADRLGSDGLHEAPSVNSLLAEERRLFYVAVTRARRRLLVTAVRSAEDDGERPSRFLHELGVEPQHVDGRPPVPLSPSGLVAALRSASVDPAASAALRRAATLRLARMAAASDGTGRPLVPAAHPDAWWGLLEPTDPGRPMHDPQVPVRTSGSSLSSIEECPLRWFLSHEVHADQPRSTAVGFGSIIHALADDLARERTPADVTALMQRVDQVWDQLAFEAPWQSEQQRAAAREALARLVAWHTTDRGRTTLASEHPFEVPIDTPAGRVLLRGSIDRVERDRDGKIHVVDFKTGKTKPSGPALQRHAQLGLYQLAVRAGALDTLATSAAEAGPDAGSGGMRDVGGAELVQLRHGDGGLPMVQPQGPLPVDEQGRTWIHDLLERAVALVLGEQFPATPGDRCATCDFRRICPGQAEGRQVVE